jgi:hypothetical protein
MPSDYFYGEIFLIKIQDLTFLSRNFYGRYPYIVKFQNSEYKVHQVDTKACGSQNFSFLAFKVISVASRQISSNNGGNGGNGGNGA